MFVLTSIPQNSEIPNPLDPFDATMTVGAKYAGKVTLAPDFFEWSGDQMVRVTIGGQHFHFRTHEARDFASALQSLALFIDESEMAA